jgi:hypothetical protein
MELALLAMGQRFFLDTLYSLHFTLFFKRITDHDRRQPTLCVAQGISNLAAVLGGVVSGVFWGRRPYQEGLARHLVIPQHTV